MDTDSIAARVAKEHRQLVAIADDVRNAISELPAGQCQGWLDRLRASFFRFRAHMIHRIALEHMGGFHKQVVELRPTLAKDVEHLQQEGRDILAAIEQVHSSLDEASPDDADTLRHIRMRTQHLLSAVEHQAEHEELLVSFAYTQDLGGES